MFLSFRRPQLPRMEARHHARRYTRTQGNTASFFRAMNNIALKPEPERRRIDLKLSALCLYRKLTSLLVLATVAITTGCRAESMAVSKDDRLSALSAILSHLSSRKEQWVITNQTQIESPAEPLRQWASDCVGAPDGLLVDYGRRVLTTADVSGLTDYCPTYVCASCSKMDVEEIFATTEGWKRFYRRYPGASGLMIFSDVGFSDDRRFAIVYVAWYSDSRRGEGRIVLLTRESNQWKVWQSLQVWIA